MTMELKKFEAPTLAEALQVIKRELGPEAVILSTKNKKSSLGLLNRSSVEVTAAIAPDALERKRTAETRMDAEMKVVLDKKPAQKVMQAYDVLSGRRLERQMQTEILTQGRSAYANQARGTGGISSSRNMGSASGFGGASASARQGPTATQASTPAPQLTQRRYIDITDNDSPAEQAILKAADRTSISPIAMQVAPAPAPGPTAGLSAPAGGKLAGVLESLLNAGVDASIARELADELKMAMIREHITRDDILRLRLAKILMARLRVARPLTERLQVPTTPRLISFVGPTGVGKTTTIAKIAAEIVINQRKPVTLATTDTFKIAAVEQLQTYAGILKVPLEVCSSADALANLVSTVGPEEVILVDTAGYGPRDQKRIAEMHELLSSVRMETHLCVAATTRDRDLEEIVKRFSVVNPDYLVVTKLDETGQYGNIFNISAKTRVPLSYFTMGQRVPEDIEVATRERVADLLLDIAEEGVSWTKPIG